MVRKVKPAAADTPADGQLAAAIRDSAQQIWLAGLGAFSKAQEEGSKVFEALVKEGRGIQLRTRVATEEKLGEVTGRVGKVAGDLSKQATQSWDRLEQVFEDRVARALNRLGVPTHTDIRALIERVDALNASVQSLGGKPARTPRAGAARTPAASKTARASKSSKSTAPAKARAPRKPRKAAAGAAR